jgi:GDP-L-fucose synthase
LIKKDSKIFIAGHRGMVGSACWRLLSEKGYSNLIGKSRSSLDLTDQKAVADFFKKEKPQIIIDAAAKVGGILANATYPYDFLMLNLQIQNNLMTAALATDVEKFIFLGSSCIYPKFANQPIQEQSLLTAPLEETNQWYALAKIAGVKMCEAIQKQHKKDFFSLMPTNLYGPNDNYDLKTSHVLPALIRKFHEAKEAQLPTVELWGTGAPLREFLHVDDLAAAVLFSLENRMNESLYNVGSGSEISIKELANTVQKTLGYEGEIVWNSKYPDGTPRKLMDSSKLNQLGWSATIDLESGIRMTYSSFLQHYK